MYESCSGGAHAPCQLQQRPSDIANKTMRICPAPAHYRSPRHTAPYIQIPIANIVHPRDVTQKYRIGLPTLNNSHWVYFTFLLQSWSLCMMSAVAWITWPQVVIVPPRFVFVSIAPIWFVLHRIKRAPAIIKLVSERSIVLEVEYFTQMAR